MGSYSRTLRGQARVHARSVLWCRVGLMMTLLLPMVLHEGGTDTAFCVGVRGGGTGVGIALTPPRTLWNSSDTCSLGEGWILICNEQLRSHEEQGLSLRLLDPHCPLSRQEGLKTSICESELGMHQPRRKVPELQGGPQPGSFSDPGHPGFLKLGLWCWRLKHTGDSLAQGF